MGKLFGTDGIRGIANKDLTPDLAYKVGRAVGHLLSEDKKGRVLVARDTRLSGHLLESSLVSGLMSIGLDVELAGVIPTPAVAYLTRKHKYLVGVVISASHNPFEYNGIKIFNSDGYKLLDEIEEKIEDLVLSDTRIYKDATRENVGRIYYNNDLKKEYENYLVEEVGTDLSNMKIAIDVGNGALYEIAKSVLERLNAEVFVINDKPDGTNINRECGSTNPKLIKDLVIKTKADIGMSFDGDADRIIAVDNTGAEIDGDHILAICASYLKEKNKLKNNKVVGTIMSNIGLRKYLESIGVGIVYTKVGDRYVLEEMRKNGYILGGEQSGHIIFLDYNTTGDGLSTGLHILEVMKSLNKTSSELNKLMKSYPQVLVNAKIRADLKNKYMEFADIQAEIKKLEDAFKDNGRVVIRPSGTESLVRIMIEGEDETILNKYAEELKDYFEKKLN